MTEAVALRMIAKNRLQARTLLSEPYRSMREVWAQRCPCMQPEKSASQSALQKNRMYS